MSIVNLTFYRLDNISQEKAVATLKQTIDYFLKTDVQEVLYFGIENQPSEIAAIGRWPNLDSFDKATQIYRKNNTLQHSPGITLDRSRSYNFKMVKEFRRYHLTSHSTSLAIHRLMRPGLTAEQAVNFVHARAGRMLFPWPGLVQYRLGYSFNSPGRLLLLNNWVSAQSRQEYIDSTRPTYPAWLDLVGLQRELVAITFLDAYSASQPPTKPWPPPS